MLGALVAVAVGVMFESIAVGTTWSLVIWAGVVFAAAVVTLVWVRSGLTIDDSGLEICNGVRRDRLAWAGIQAIRLDWAGEHGRPGLRVRVRGLERPVQTTRATAGMASFDNREALAIFEDELLPRARRHHVDIDRIAPTWEAAAAHHPRA